jgi:hypothetical protein
LLAAVLLGTAIGTLTVAKPKIGVGLSAAVIVSVILNLIKEEHAHDRVYNLLFYSLALTNQIILQLLIHSPRYVNRILPAVFFATGAECLSTLIVHFDAQLKADVRGVELDMDRQLYLNICNYCDKGWFYAVAFAQLVVIQYELKSMTLMSGTELRRLRRANDMTKYSACLAKSSMFVALIMLGQLTALGVSTRSVTECCISIAIAMALLDTVCIREQPRSRG